MFTLFPQAEVLLNNIRTQVAKNIKENYGKNNIITKPWNETMDLVHHFTLLGFGLDCLHYTD